MSAAGDMLQASMKRMGYSQGRLAREIGIDSSNINKYVVGHAPVPLRVAMLMEKVLDFTAESLLVTQVYDQIRDARADGDLQSKRATRWTPEEDEIILETMDMPADEVMELTGRSYAAVCRRRGVLRGTAT